MSYSYQTQSYEYGGSSGTGSSSNQVSRIAQDLLTLNGGNSGASQLNSYGTSGGFATGAGYSAGGYASGQSSYGASGSYGGALTSGFGATQYSSGASSAATGFGGVSSAVGTGAYVSEIENALLRAQAPIQINETEEITVNGERGIYANKNEVANWRGVIPIEQYVINQDANPEVITKRTGQSLEYIQELAIRYLRPPTPPAPGEIIIKQDPNSIVPPAPPLIIRQQPARPATPEPLVIREAPPQAPAQVGRKVITISGKRVPPPPRKVIIERLPQIPSKPQSILVERWLPYAQVKRRVIFQGAAQQDAVVVKPRNVIVQWEAPQVQVKREVKYLGVIRANPAEYVQRYGSSLKTARELPQYVLDIKAPDGLVLAADSRYNSIYELEGDLQALRLVDLEREGLSEYRQYLQGLGISYQAGSGSVGGGFSVGNSYGNGFSSSAGGVTAALYGTSGLVGNEVGSVSSSASSDQIEQVFRTLNRDNDNRISRSEAERAFLQLNSRLGRSYGESEVNAFFAQLDTNGDGYLDFNEFRRLFLNRL